MSSNPRVRPKPRIKIYFFLLTIRTDEVISTPEVMTFFPILASLNKNSEHVSNPIP